MSRTFLLTWNPQRWRWTTLPEDLASFDLGHSLSTRWSCGTRRDLPVGSRVFLMKLGRFQDVDKGIVGTGVTITESHKDQHWSDDRKDDMALYVGVQFDNLSIEPLIALPALRQLPATFNWTPQGSGIEVPHEAAAAVENLLSKIPSAMLCGPDEIPRSTSYLEGGVRTVQVNSFERSRAARAACIAHYGGPRCVACGFNFGKSYGAAGHGYIHVHHIVPLAEVGATYQVDPVRDLIPLCPNCHAIVHLKDPPYLVDELRELLRAAKA